MQKFVLVLSLCSIIRFGLWAQEEGVLLSNWQDTTLVASSAHDNTYNEVWGLAVNNLEIAVIGSTDGTHFINVTDPVNPEEIHFVKGGSVGRSIIHRDFHDYNGYLYAVADEGTFSTLQVIDISMIPDTVVVVYDSKEYIRRSHNIFIDSSSALLYACFTNGDSVGFAGLRVFDIEDPFAPKVVGSFNNISGLNLTGLHDIYVDQGIAYLNAGNDGLGIVDFSDMDNPELLAALSTNQYPESGYNHAGWLSEDKKSYYLADETFGTRVKAMDVSSLPEIKTFDLLSSGSGHSAEIPHNLIVHGDYLYASYYFDGLQVFDISDTSSIERVLYYDTSTIPHQRGIYRGAWGVYPFLPSGNILVSDMQNGLFVIEGLDGNLLASEDLLAQTTELQVFPNPTTGILNFDLPSHFKGDNIEVEIHKMNGSLVYKNFMRSQDEISLNLDLSEGMYILSIKNRLNLASARFIKY